MKDFPVAARADTTVSATVLKRILCRVPAAGRDRFAAGQRPWHGLAALGGFRGQTGGWTLEDPNEALILGLWSDELARAAFMSGAHDTLYAASRQAEVVAGIAASTWDRTADPGAGLPLEDAAGRTGGFLRLADCRLFPGRESHFLAVQREVWNPAMQAAGVLAASLWRHRDEPVRFLSVSLWRSHEAERAWREQPFFECWRRAGVEDDCEIVSGRMARVEDGWRVDWVRP